MKIILVEGITDVNLVRYIYSKMKEEYNFDDFEATKRGKIVTFKNRYERNLSIINLKGQDNLIFALQEIIKPIESEISKYGKETGLWDLSKKEFQPIIQFVESIFN